MEMKAVIIVGLLVMIEYANSRPQYSGRGGYGGQGYDSGAVSNAYNNLNRDSHDFGYAVEDPKYGNYQGRQETGSGNSVRGSYYLREADGSLRKVDYVADHPGGFRATITDKHGSRTFGNDDDYGSQDSYDEYGNPQKTAASVYGGFSH